MLYIDAWNTDSILIDMKEILSYMLHSSKPGQHCSLQATVLLAGPLQGVPPQSGTGLVQLRNCSLKPVPQVRVHLAPGTSSQSDHPPSSIYV